jgi:MFS transporter, DHA2 family, multidrug resistance protein
VFRFVMLTPVVLIPGFLGNIQRYRPLQTGHALAWVALPQFLVVWAVAWIIIQTNSRVIFAMGLTIVAGACWAAAKVDPSWAGNSFEAIELVLAAGLACAYVGMVGSIVLEALEAGALNNAADVCTFSGVMHFVRIFGGGVGVSAMTRFLTVREQFHSNLLGLHVQAGQWLSDTRLHMLTAGLLPRSAGLDGAQARATAILDQQIRAQAYTMAIEDGFVLMCWVAIAFLLVMIFMRPGKVSYNDLRKM